MTPRSPKSSKSTTISRRLRSRAAQNISVQPPELPQIRTLRSRRTAAVAASARNPPSGQISVTSQPEHHHDPSWDPPDLRHSSPRGQSSDPAAFAPQSASRTNSLLSRPLNSSPYSSPHLPPTALSSYARPSQALQYHLPASPAAEPPSIPLSQYPDHTANFHLRLSAEPGFHSDQPSELQNMSALDFMVPSHYGSMDHYGSSAPLDSHSYSMGQQSQSSAAYAPTYISSPPLRSQSSRAADHSLPPYQTTSVSRSPYQQPLGPMRGSPTPMTYPASTNDSSAILGSPPPHAYAYPAMQPPLSGQNISSLGNHGSSYPPANAYPPTSYEMGYGSLPTSLYPPTSTPAYSYDHTSGMAQSGSAAELSSSPEQRNVRVLNQRPKPQCWEHGCNGRQFSTFSNLLRHQREKSGTAAKSYCPRCGAEFTRTTARNGHMAHEKCKARRPSDSSA